MNSRVRPPIDDRPVWSIVCFVVSRSARGQGLTNRLLDGAIDYAVERGAPALEAYPVDVGDGRIPAAVGYTGLLSTFLAAGFEVVHQIDSPQATVRRVDRPARGVTAVGRARRGRQAVLRHLSRCRHRHPSGLTSGRRDARRLPTGAQIARPRLAQLGGGSE